MIDNQILTMLIQRVNTLEKTVNVLASLETATGSSGGIGDVGARVYRTSNQSIPDTTTTAIEFDAQSYASSGVHSTTVNPSRLIAPQTGIYTIGYTVLFTQVASSSQRFAYLIVNNSDFISYDAMYSGTFETIFDVFTMTTEWKMNANDYVEVKVFQASGSSLDVYGFDESATVAWIRRVA